MTIAFFRVFKLVSLSSKFSSKFQVSKCNFLKFCAFFFQILVSSFELALPLSPVVDHFSEERGTSLMNAVPYWWQPPLPTSRCGTEGSLSLVLLCELSSSVLVHIIHGEMYIASLKIVMGKQFLYCRRSSLFRQVIQRPRRDWASTFLNNSSSFSSRVNCFGPMCTSYSINSYNLWELTPAEVTSLKARPHIDSSKIFSVVSFEARVVGYS